MKKINIILLLTIILQSFISEAQISEANRPIVPLEEERIYFESKTDFAFGTYIKDINNLLNKYIGIWKTTYQNKNYQFDIIKVTNDYEYGLSIDELLIRYKITDSTSNSIIADITNLSNDDPLIIVGDYLASNKAYYALNYLGLNDDCGQNGKIFIRVENTTLNQMKLALSVKGEKSLECNSNVSQIIPTSNITLIKQ